MSQISIRRHVMKLLQSRYAAEWDVRVEGGRAELRQRRPNGVTRQIFIKVMQHSSEPGCRIQPSVAVTFDLVNEVRDRITPRHAYTRDGPTAYAFLNDFLSPPLRKNGGWYFEDVISINENLPKFLDLVDRTVVESRFFERLSCLEDYVSLADKGELPLTFVMPHLLYALVALGRVDEAGNRARASRERSIQFAIDGGFEIRPIDTEDYDGVISYVEELGANGGVCNS